jgi:zinc transport system substrate-binding protein
MLRKLAVLLTLSGAAWADTPLVLTDIAPIQSLTARVMQGIGTPDVLLPPGASPHDYAFRPSDADRLARAELIIWVGPRLTPWLAAPIDTLAPAATKLELLAAPGWRALPLRLDPAFADAEDTAGIDPHAWLDPANAAVFMTRIAQALAAADPQNGPAYLANAAEAEVEMAELRNTTIATLLPFRGATFITPHDGYQYFEAAFGLPAAGAISLTDASTPGPARIAALRDRVASGDIACVLTDPQTSPEWTDLLREGSIAKTAFVDPDGGSQAAGSDTLSDLYPAIIRSLAAALSACLG